MERRDGELWNELRDRVNAEFRRRGANRYADWTVLGKLALLTAAATGCYCAILRSSPSPAWLLGWCSLGIISFFLIVNSAHDCSHGCLFRSSKANELSMLGQFALLGIDGGLWGLRHLSAHHPHTNVMGEDPDSVANPYLRLSPHHPWRPWFRYQHFYAVLLYALAFPHTAWIQDFDHVLHRPLPYLRKVKRWDLALTRMLVVKAIYLTAFVLVPVFGFSQPAGWVLAGVIAQQAAASLVFVLTICLNHYVSETTFFADGEMVSEQHHLRHQLISSADWHATNPIVCAVMGGANAHTAHHLFPAFSHRHYHWVSAIICEFCAERGLPYNSFSFCGGLRSHFLFLRELGRRPVTA